MSDIAISLPKVQNQAGLLLSSPAVPDGLLHLPLAASPGAADTVRAARPLVQGNVRR